jgi:putative endonuclease
MAKTRAFSSEVGTGSHSNQVHADCVDLSAVENASNKEIDAASPENPKKTASPARVAAFRTGVSAETRAAAWLMAKGYRILARRFRTPYGEIDIVARRRNLLAFIEVKARATLDDAAYAVTPRQQARIINAAQAWLQVWLVQHPEHADFEQRFDVLLIAPRHLPRHLLAAFDAST